MGTCRPGAEGARPLIQRTVALARLNKAAFDALVALAPAERGPATTVITLPLPDGSFGRFTVLDSPILAPGLAAQFTEIRTFAGPA